MGHEGAGGRHRHSRQNLQEGALAGAVHPDQPQYLTALEREADIAESPELFAGLDGSAEQARGEASHLVLDRGDVPAVAEPVSLGDAGEVDGRIGHWYAGPLRSRLQ